MPALPNVAKTLRVACSGTDSVGGLWLTRFFIQYAATAPTNAQLATFDAAVNTAWGTNLKPLHGNDTIMNQIETVDLSSPTGAVDISGVTQQGTRAGTYIPAAAAAVSSYKIARRYRGGHPRGYWPFGMTADLQNPTSWTTSFITAVTSGLDAFFTAVLAAGWTGAGTLTQVNVSYYSGFTVVTNPVTGRARNVPTLRATPTIDTITSLIVRPNVGTQRRRTNFIG